MWSQDFRPIRALNGNVSRLVFSGYWADDLIGGVILDERKRKENIFTEVSLLFHRYKK